jgi:hypothetical protein
MRASSTYLGRDLPVSIHNQVPRTSRRPLSGAADKIVFLAKMWGGIALAGIILTFVALS